MEKAAESTGGSSHHDNEAAVLLARHLSEMMW